MEIIDTDVAFARSDIAIGLEGADVGGAGEGKAAGDGFADAGVGRAGDLADGHAGGCDRAVAQADIDFRLFHRAGDTGVEGGGFDDGAAEIEAAMQHAAGLADDGAVVVDAAGHVGAQPCALELAGLDGEAAIADHGGDDHAGRRAGEVCERGVGRGDVAAFEIGRDAERGVGGGLFQRPAALRRARERRDVGDAGDAGGALEVDLACAAVVDAARRGAAGRAFDLRGVDLDQAGAQVHFAAHSSVVASGREVG